jgi:UDP:flavonoid glycosyltransferase YjiC (YdhE family)
VGQAANLPTVLVENFTWDWIYQGYVHAEPRFAEYIAYLRRVFHRADYHVQTEPVCHYDKSADLLTSPVARQPQTSRKKIREQLGIPRNGKLVLVTMGGVPGQYEFLHRLEELRGVFFVIPGSERKTKRGNVILLPHRSEFYHPDLVNASDAVVGKLGYSTVSEVYHAGIPFFYVSRPLFRESKVMERFARKQMHGALIQDTEFQNGDWLWRLSDVLALPRIERKEANGAVEVARFVSGLMR